MTYHETASPAHIVRLRAAVRGAVQGVGFRPTVYRLATELGLSGWVQNAPEGVQIEVEGTEDEVRRFLRRLVDERPPRSFIQSLESSLLDPVGYEGFAVRHSATGGALTALVMPDLGTCPDCLAELRDPANRRFRYPFTNCTNCGPRFSIIQGLPYDRHLTTMRGFQMCPACQAEYDDPADRRFHAQPNACPACGPHLELWTPDGELVQSHDAALLEAAAALRRGAIVAAKGIGGFHLLADATNELAVARLRLRKSREEKPFALLYPSLERLREECCVSELEEQLLTSPEAPIVLLRRRPGASAVVPGVAPGSRTLGVMLPSNPLHHLLLAELGTPIVATSGNRSEEPICTDEREAVQRLGPIADLLLVHDRPIARHVDDSIVRVVMGREMLLRRARGYAPLPIPRPPDTGAAAVLATGAHLKNTIAVANAEHIFVSQHIGDLETAQSFAAFTEVIGSLSQLYAIEPALLACDRHPDYRSTIYATALARQRELPLIQVQHHIAHVLACMAENELAPPVLGVAWDGTGYGSDGTIWGGEWLLATAHGVERVAHLRTFRLPGGDQAIREPRRAALGMLYEVFRQQMGDLRDLTPVRECSAQELAIFSRMIERGINAPLTSSAGRLFDAVAAIIGLRQRVSFEGQAALQLEHLLDEHAELTYPFLLWEDQRPIVVDWEPMLHALIDDVRAGTPQPVISARLHATLAEMIVAVAQHVGTRRVALSGGCFQNAALAERAIRRLRVEGFKPYWHQRIPPNDGGVAVGQIVAALRAPREE